ncbi:MAG: helix-turn-helix transcriptional regulator [Candidatus Borkfalkiaceae bacterium]|nr:helix-turn-helix transcriptional regulator [Clostridia bacterium]MDY6223746.1 helix-turn-helix transcriptional regulator [Christensenellaceae bacterium]
MNDIGRAIQTLRKRKNLTQSDLAGELNVSGQAVSKWENNLSQPDLDTMQRIMQIFGVTWEEFRALCEGNEEKLAQAEEQTAKQNAEVAASAAMQAAARAGEAAAEIKAQPQLLGVCAYCGKALYREKEIGVKTPKTVCVSCAAHAKQKIKGEKAEKSKSFRNAMIIPAIIVGILALIAVIIGLTGEAGATALVYIPLAVLIWLPIPQIFWEEDPVDWVFETICCKTIRMPGVIFELDIDGILWAIAVKCLLSVLSVLLGVMLFLLGYIICMVLAPFSFVPALISAKKEVAAAGVINDDTIVSELNRENGRR